MRYSGLVRFIGIAMGITLLLSTGFLVFLALLGYGLGNALNSGHNDFPSQELAACIPLGFLGLLTIFISVLKRKRSTPFIFGTSALLIFALSLQVNEATGAWTMEMAMLVFSFASCYLAFQTWKENKSA
ncbi:MULTISPECIES: hypothetical protein [Bacillus]|uniref:Uncharacterized protein n=2 Tax=Bacillus TaxID=1386 RepID=A0A0M4FRC4_9BACI|nr:MULTISPECIES: hypothetical protein [Bacillus]ALC80268.1 hypothetical protein AM592_00630 [Bacillus gobiensis]MBP1083901.1 hypothetical protein [Bacillus capparidis]MED1098381.1 hypothetical protein [Bacillus capparidis]